MARITDQDGIDAPFDRAMKSAMREDAKLRAQAEAFAAAHRFDLFGLGPCPCGDDLAGECKKCKEAK